jgi:hypothetical protein
MTPRWLALTALALLAAPARPEVTAIRAWPHRAMLKSVDNRAVAFRAYTLGGDLIIAVDRSGNPIATSTGTPTFQALTPKDTITAETPGDFPLDLSKGPVVFIADDSLRLTVGRNPYGSIHQVSATGRRFTVRLVDDRFVIDAK